MNYLAHGYRFLDNPLKLAGTAVPDWLSVVDRQVRIRSHRVLGKIDSLNPSDRQLAEGMLQHLKDDDLFHRCPCFVMLEAELSIQFRTLMPDPYDHRPPFLGHIVTELLLDAMIAEEQPEVLDQYYESLGQVSPQLVQDLVNRLASRSTARLADFMTMFHEARVLYDYSDDALLLRRLNQVLRRVTLPPLEDSAMHILQIARRLLRLHASELLAAVEGERPKDVSSDASWEMQKSESPPLL